MSGCHMKLSMVCEGYLEKVSKLDTDMGHGRAKENCILVMTNLTALLPTMMILARNMCAVHEDVHGVPHQQGGHGTPSGKEGTHIPHGHPRETLGTKSEVCVRGHANHQR